MPCFPQKGDRQALQRGIMKFKYDNIDMLLLVTDVKNKIGSNNCFKIENKQKNSTQL